MKDTSIPVLIVEDSEDDALLIIRNLKKGGYNTVYERVEIGDRSQIKTGSKNETMISAEASNGEFGYGG